MEKQDDLLKELAGNNVKVEYIDPLDRSEATRDLLEVAPLKPESAITRMDKKFSTQAGGKGYRVSIRGEYYAISKEHNGKKIKKPYEVAVNVASLHAALSTIKSKLLDAAVKRKHVDFAGVRTHHIVEAVPLSAETPESTNLQFMSREKLEAHVKDHRVPINPVEYPDTMVLRSAIVDYTLNPKGFEAREVLRQKDRQETAELAALNPELTPAA